MIAGEGLVGILLAVLAIIPIGGSTLAEILDVSGRLGLSESVAKICSILVFGLIILSLLKFSLWKKRSKTNK